MVGSHRHQTTLLESLEIFVIIFIIKQLKINTLNENKVKVYSNVITYVKTRQFLVEGLK